MAHPTLPTSGAPVQGDLGHLNHHDELHGRFNNGVEIRSGTTAAKPLATAVEAGTLYWDTTLQTMSRSDGAVWVALSAGATDHGALTGLADDDHPQYETTAEVAAQIATHAGLADPHTGYRLESADHSHQSTGLQAGQLDHGAALTGLGDDDHPQYVLKTIIDAAGDLIVGSGADAYTRLAKGADGEVLSMVAGSLDWAAPSAGGDLLFASEGAAAGVAINSVTDITVFTQDITVAVGDVIEFVIHVALVNSSGGVRSYTVTQDFDGQFDAELTSVAAGNGATLLLVMTARMAVESTSVARWSGNVAWSDTTSAGTWGGATVRTGRDTSAADLTGTTSVQFKVRSDSASATQTAVIYGVSIRKLNT